MFRKIAKNDICGLKIESPIERIPMKGLIRIMMTDGLYGIFPHGDITIAVYETLEYAKNAEKVLNS